MKKESNLLPILVFAVILAVTGLVWASKNLPSGNTQNVGPPADTGDAQVVTLGLRQGDYYPKVINVEYGRPVKIVADSSLAGCSQFVVQPQLGINANFMRSKEYIFTPEKRGSFTFTCSMGMYRGTINVV